MAFPADDYGPRMNYIGYRTTDSLSSPYDWWFEKIAPADLDPPNLWLAMRERRLGSGVAGSGGSAGASATGGSGGSAATSGSGGSGNAAAGGSSATGGGGTKSAGGNAAKSTDDDSSGCGCRMNRQSEPSAWWLALIFAAVLRRRSSR
jgi:MYXO-CTERM domain-containing protein